MPNLSNKITVSTLVASSLKELFGGVKTFVGYETLIRLYWNYEIDTSIGISTQAAYYAAGFALYTAVASAVFHVQLNRIHENVHDLASDVRERELLPMQMDVPVNASQNVRVKKWMMGKLIQPILGLGDLMGHAGEALGFFIFMIDILLKNLVNHTVLLVITAFFHMIALLLAFPDFRTCWRAMCTVNRQENDLLSASEVAPLLPTSASEADLWAKIVLPIKELFNALGMLVTCAIVNSTLHCKFGADTPFQVSVGSLILSVLIVPFIFASSLCCHYYLTKRSAKFNEQPVAINAEITPVVSDVKSFFSQHLLRWRHAIYRFDRWGHALEVIDACNYLMYTGLQNKMPEAAFITLMMVVLLLSFQLARPDNKTCQHNIEEMIAEENFASNLRC